MNSRKKSNFWLLLVICQIVIAAAYLGLNAALLGWGFMLGDSAKLFASLIFAPLATYFLWQFLVAFRLAAVPRLLRPVLLVLLVALPLMAFWVTTYESIAVFERPTLKAPPYPSDYWHSFARTTLADTTIPLGAAAIVAYRDKEGEPDLAQYIAFFDTVTFAQPGRKLHYFWDVGPAGILGPLLSGIHLALGALIIVALIALIFRTLSKAPHNTRLFSNVSGAFLSLIAFLPLQLLSLVSIWGGAREPLTSIATVIPVLMGLVGSFLLILLRLLAGSTRWARLAAYLVPGLLAGVVPLAKPLAPWLLLTGRELFPQLPWLPVFCASVLLIVLTTVCIAVVLSDYESLYVPDPPTTKG